MQRWRKSEPAYEGIKRHLKELGEKTGITLHPHHGVSTALTTSSQARGNWGEVKLRRLFEMAGMSENIDFDEQTTLSDGGRPDFVVRLPDSRVIPIDSKATGAISSRPPNSIRAMNRQRIQRKGHAQENRRTQSKGYRETMRGGIRPRGQCLFPAKPWLPLHFQWTRI